MLPDGATLACPMVEPHRPLSLRLLAVVKRGVRAASGGRWGGPEHVSAAPRGRALAVITAVHRRVYRWTGGFVGGNAGGMPTLLLTTTGRKTGQPRTVPLPYFEHDGGLAVVASFAGNPKNPAWYENLVADPDVEVQLQRRRFRATATTASAEQRPALWAGIVARAPMYGEYQRMTERQIPVVLLEENVLLVQ
jgi:deazaflavin-dependent oxidoreductase (nitroreductase family)